MASTTRLNEVQIQNAVAGVNSVSGSSRSNSTGVSTA